MVCAGWMDKWIYVLLHGWLNDWLHGWMDGWMIEYNPYTNRTWLG